MAFSKLGVNLSFACLVSILALAAAASIYLNSGRPAVQTAATGGSPGNSLPENHPDIDISKRISALSQLIARDPENPEYSIQIANLYYDVGQYQPAAEYYQRSLDLRPGDPNVETDLAVCLHYLGQDDKALEILDKVLSYRAGFPQALFNKGIILIDGKKDVKAGIAVWENLLRTNPDFAQKADLQQKIGKLKGSIR